MRTALLLALVLTATMLPGCSPSSEETPAAWQAGLDAFIQYQMDSKGLPTLSIAVVDDQNLAWAEGYGLADPERNVPATAGPVLRKST